MTDQNSRESITPITTRTIKLRNSMRFGAKMHHHRHHYHHHHHHSLPVPCYTGKYEIWRKGMKMYLDSQGLLDIVKDKFGKRPLQTFADRPLNISTRTGLALGKINQRLDRFLLLPAKKLITRICELMRVGFPESNDLSDVLWPPLLTATQLGIQEIVVEIIKTHRPMIWIKDRHNRTIFHHAVQYRHEKIYCLLLDLEQEEKYQVVQFVSEIDNSNILHLAASMKSINPASNLVLAAALQMGRELIWFEEVKKLVPVSFQNEQMTPENKTPIEVFKDEHTQLVKDGEKWIETTASAYTLSTVSHYFFYRKIMTRHHVNYC